MKRLSLILGFVALVPAAFAAYQYSYSDAFGTTTLDPNKWFLNGTVASAPGLTTSGAGGAVISKQYAPSVEQEVKVKLNLAVSGGTYDLMLRASDNATPGFVAQGSFYAVEIHNPTVTATNCSATLIIRKYINNTWTNLT